MSQQPPKPRKRSRQVRLGRLATGAVAVGLSGCGATSWQRNVYTSVEDCAADYSIAECTRLGRTGGEGRYLGPVYRLRNNRPSSCHGDDRGPGHGWAGNWNRQPVEQVLRGAAGTACRSLRSGRSWWGLSGRPWTSQQASTTTSTVRRGLFGGRGAGISFGG
jgi:uncharacterized protein YgiB involved in biofilm formation